MTFNDLNLNTALFSALDDMGYHTPTTIQQKVFSVAMSGKDVCGIAQTGTGKTIAYLLPCLRQWKFDKNKDPQILIVVPTRELVTQVVETIHKLSSYMSLIAIGVYGGVNINTQQIEVEKGADVIVATPGRLYDLAMNGAFKTKYIKKLVIDEMDEMLNLGFRTQLKNIMDLLPQKRQNLLFSATMPVKMRDLARKILTNPVEINIAISKPPEQIIQKAFVVYEPQKVPIITDMLSSNVYKNVIVFCSKKQNVKQLTQELKRAKLAAEEIHSDLDQKQREQVLQDFRNHKLSILVATDILSRGIDIEEIDLVINYDVPNDGEDYIHRIGRTARAATTGTAFTLISEQEQYKFLAIEELLGAPVPKGAVPPEFGETPEYAPKQRSRGNFKQRPGHKKR